MGLDLTLYLIEQPKNLEQTLKHIGFQLDKDITTETCQFRTYAFFNTRCNEGFTLWDWGPSIDEEILEYLSKYLPSGLMLQYQLSIGTPFSPNDYLMRRFSQIVFYLKKKYRAPILKWGGDFIEEKSWREFYDNWREIQRNSDEWAQEFHSQLRLIQLVAKGLGHNINVGLPDS